MRVRVRAAIAACALLGGCAEMATGLAAYADQLDAESGAWWPDEHQTDRLTGDCPAYSEFGRVNNQTYYRVRNTGSRSATMTMTWSTGVTSTFWLEPGQTSDFVYMTPSVTPSHLSVEC